jgi:CheY-like chemotaxis protein
MIPQDTDFVRLVKDALVNLHDNAALETHPLVNMLPPPPQPQANRAAYLRSMLLEAIQQLRPEQRELSLATPEWRPYLILTGRYVDGTDLQDLEARLSLSTRHLCREHGRALRAVASLLRQKVAPAPQPLPDMEEPEPASEEVIADELGAFEVTRASLDLAAALQAALEIGRHRAQSMGIEFVVSLPADLPPIQGDRVILRQILLALINRAAEVYPDQVALVLHLGEGAGATISDREEEPSLQVASYWAQQFGATVQIVHAGTQGPERMVLSWPRADYLTIMVVDDQEPAIRLFQRFLSRSQVRVVGVRDASEVLPLARRLQPWAITLDVMMPSLDGWELLQKLQADPDTQRIPVIVCSVWDVPELALSYGAAGFLKKPVTQQDLLAALDRLRRGDKMAAQTATGS